MKGYTGFDSFRLHTFVTCTYSVPSTVCTEFPVLTHAQQKFTVLTKDVRIFSQNTSVRKNPILSRFHRKRHPIDIYIYILIMNLLTIINSGWPLCLQSCKSIFNILLKIFVLFHTCYKARYGGVALSALISFVWE